MSLNSCLTTLTIFASSVPSAHPSTSHGSVLLGALLCANGFGVPFRPLTRLSKSTSPPPFPFSSKLLPAARLFANDAVCCSMRRTSRKCCVCSCSTRVPSDLITLASAYTNSQSPTHVMNWTNWSAFRTSVSEASGLIKGLTRSHRHCPELW